jgi:hypothetical protein
MNEAEIVEDIIKFTHDPYGYCYYAFPWGEEETELVNNDGPRKWQKKFLKQLTKHLQNPKTRHKPFRYAAASGHGIGKSALIGMVLSWGLSTCENTKAVITANTKTQLVTKTMPEVAKWFRLSINSNWWVSTATSVFTAQRRNEKAWRADAIPWSKTNTEAFAGLHNKGKRIILIFDEGSAIDDSVWDVAEGALTDEETEIIWIVFGNPTRNTGRFRECFRKFKHLWITDQIDAREVEGTNKEQHDEWIKTYGVDSDFVKVRVRGIFPSQSFRQFISTEDVDRAWGKKLKETEYNFAPKILTLDPAWSGEDEAVFGLRQGNNFEILKTVEKNDNDLEVATLLARLEDEHKADAVFIDAGYGTGIYSAGKTLKRDWKIVWFSGKATDNGYINKRAEMWGNMRDWLKEGGAIPKDTMLHQDLISPETVPRGDGKIQLESKEDMKKRGIPSPNRADALALSFAYPITKKKPKKASRTNFSHSQGWMG